MSTTVTRPVGTTVAGTSTSTRFAAWGLAAGAAGLVSIVASGFTGAVYDDDLAGDAVAITDRLAEMAPQILVFHTAAMASAFLMVVFAAGIRQHLARRLPADSLLPSVASSGLMLVSVALLMGSGLTTEFVFGVSEPGLLVAETAVFFNHWINTIPWLWGGAGLAALAVAGASLRHGAVPRWIGWVSVLLGGLTFLFGISPLQYMAGMTGPLWLLVVSAGLLYSGRGRA